MCNAFKVNMISYILLKPILWILACCNILLKYIFGCSLFSGKTKDKIRSFKEFEFSAHRLKVIFRAIPYSLSEINLDQFLLSHISYEDPRECIAKNKNVSLMNINSKYALFAVVEDGFDVYDSTHGPFVFRLKRSYFCTFNNPKSWMLLLQNALKQFYIGFLYISLYIYLISIAQLIFRLYVCVLFSRSFISSKICKQTVI